MEKFDFDPIRIINSQEKICLRKKKGFHLSLEMMNLETIRYFFIYNNIYDPKTEIYDPKLFAKTFDDANKSVNKIIFISLLFPLIIMMKMRQTFSISSKNRKN